MQPVTKALCNDENGLCQLGSHPNGEVYINFIFFLIQHTLCVVSKKTLGRDLYNIEISSP